MKKAKSKKVAAKKVAAKGKKPAVKKPAAKKKSAGSGNVKGSLGSTADLKKGKGYKSPYMQRAIDKLKPKPTAKSRAKVISDLKSGKGKSGLSAVKAGSQAKVVKGGQGVDGRYGNTGRVKKQELGDDSQPTRANLKGMDSVFRREVEDDERDYFDDWDDDGL